MLSGGDKTYANAKKSAILHHDPANKLYVDFAGDGMSYTDPQTGEAVSVQVFVAVLPFSNYAYAMAAPSQSTDDFLYDLVFAKAKMLIIQRKYVL